MIGEGRRKKHLRIRHKIEEEAIIEEKESVSRGIGRHREFLVIKILEALRAEKVIRDFVAPGNLSYPDVERGIDVFVVKVGENKYHVVPLSVTGKTWTAKHVERHPEIPVIEIDFGERYEDIKEKIRKEIRRYV